MVHQHFRLVAPFTVAENVVLGDHRGAGRAFSLHPRAIERRVAELGERYGIAVDPRARIWQLSLGEQQRVEILKALYRDARILILDEPTAVLTPQEADVAVRDAARDGGRWARTVIFISHKLHEVKAVADRVTVLRGGRSIATVAIADATPRSLAALMVGRERRARSGVATTTATVGDADARARRRLGRRATAASGACKDVSLIGRAPARSWPIAGVAGNGQRELAETIAGHAAARPRGTCRGRGRACCAAAIRARRSAPRVAYVPEDRLAHRSSRRA